MELILSILVAGSAGGTAVRPQEVALPAERRLASSQEATVVPGGAATVPLITFPGCLAEIHDLATGLCVQASSNPTLGMLYPLGIDLNLDAAGNVGMGTTSPSAKLEVLGTGRFTDTLTLAPPGDQALELATGNLYKGGSLFLHDRGGIENTGVGDRALASVTTGFSNTASGEQALFMNTTGFRNSAHGHGALFYNTTGNGNTACGDRALYRNTTGILNTAAGHRALRSNTTGRANTASGYRALYANTTGIGNTATGAYALRYNTSGSRNVADGFQALYRNTTGVFNAAVGTEALYSNTGGVANTVMGYRALYLNTTGSFNVAIGDHAGESNTTGSNNIFIGNSGRPGDFQTLRIGEVQYRAFMSGVHGSVVGKEDAVGVVVDGLGQLGTIVSARRFKDGIEDMGDRTDRLLSLRPVTFRYKKDGEGGGNRALQYGLIAEEVAEVFPELVVHDDEGRPLTLRYHFLSSMLLNELQEDRARIEALEKRLAVLER